MRGRQEGQSEKEMQRQKQRLGNAIAVRSPKPRHASASRCFQRPRSRFPPTPPKEVSPAHTRF